MDFNAKVQEVMASLLALSEQANMDAAKLREEQQYSAAQDSDNVAEALRCAAAIVLTRGIR